MKRFFLLSVLLFSMLSCSIENDGPIFRYEAVPIESVTVPEEFNFGSVHDISASYFRPTGCHVFNSFLFETNGNEITVAVINTVYEDRNCQVYGENENEIDVSFNFEVNNSESYIFKFWQGEDATGNDIYYVVEVPVTID